MCFSSPYGARSAQPPEIKGKGHPTRPLDSTRSWQVQSRVASLMRRSNCSTHACGISGKDKNMKLKPVSLALFSLGLVTGLAVIHRACADQFAVDSTKISASMWNQTNAYRQANGVPELVIEPAIVQVAQEYAEFLARKNLDGHTADGREPGQRVAAQNIKNCGVWENFYEYWSAPDIASWETVAAEAMEDWKRSPGHRKNLLRAQATHMGVGAAGWNHEGKNYYKIVQMFIDGCMRPD
jgi:uncharacterized protein YkwD